MVVVVKRCKSEGKKTDYVAETHIKREREKERSMANFKAAARTRRDILVNLYFVCVCVYVCMCVCVWCVLYNAIEQLKGI
jgi:hypothetical protein